MAKRLFIIGLISLFIIVSFTPAYGDTSLKKLGRGVSNCLTFPAEILLQISRVNTSDGPIAALTWGVLKGFAWSSVRAIVGVYEVATFPIPYPKNYRPIMTDPEFFFEEQNW